MSRVPAYRRVIAWVLIWAFPFPVTTEVSAQQLMPHMESCLEWDDSDGQFGAASDCKTSTTILFMALPDGRVIEQEVPPGGRFRSGAAQPRIWMFTACPVGYVPNVQFSADNADIILPSLYHCLLQTRPGA